MPRGSLLLIALTLAAPAGAEDALTAARDGEVLIGPMAITCHVQGVPVELRIASFLSVSTGGEVRAGLRLVADLGGLQDKVGAIVDTIPLPTNVCDHFGLDNVVARIWGKSLGVAGNTAVLTLKGDVDVWSCLQNPFGSPFESRNLNQPFEARLPVELQVSDAQAVALRLGTPSVNLGGSLGGVTDGVLRIAGVDLNARWKATMDQAVGDTVLRQGIPAAYLNLSPTIEAARFFENSGRLAGTVEMNATPSGAGLTQLLQTLAGYSEHPVR